MEPILIDGSMGEGGGQILRSALALAAILGRPVRIVNIRAKRRNPGLRPQHLTAVRAIATITGGRVEGARVGSRELYFEPRTVKSGSFSFDIGTAGSVSLVLQAILPVLAFAEGPVEATIKGGTDVPMAPTIDYVRAVLLRHLRKLGFNVELDVLRRGHYPRGGGIVRVRVGEPPRGFRSVSYTEQGRLVRIAGISHAVKLPRHVAERQAASAAMVLKNELGVDAEFSIEWYPPERDPHLGPGSGVLVYAEFTKTIMGADSLGARGKRAEIVGREAARMLVEDIKTGAPLDRHMSDMILIYLGLASGPSRVFGAMLTLHAKTMLDLLSIMVPGFGYKINRGGIGEPFEAEIRPGSIPP